ncbi:MAG: hypothetical protein RL693_721 [Verrucomicrobiota bacterium]|jgi:hypothetical protein
MVHLDPYLDCSRSAKPEAISQTTRDIRRYFTAITPIGGGVYRMVDQRVCAMRG